MTNEQRPRFARDNIKGIIFALGILLTIMVVGVLGYMLIEHYQLIDALYMTVITIATVGFKEVAPLSRPGMVFTIILILVSFSIYAYVLTNFTRYLISGIFTNYFKDRKVEKRIKALSDHVIVVGYGRNGRQTTDELVAHNEKIVIVEKDENVIAEIREETDLLYVQGDATHDEVLSAAGIERAKALIAALPIDADNLFVVLSARQISPKMKIISRASEENSDIKLKRAGATNVIMPAKTGGQRMAKLVAQPDVVEFMDYVLLQTVNETSIEEVSCADMICKYENKSIGELKIRHSTGANIIGIRRKDGTYLVNPGPEITLDCDDHIFVLGKRDEIVELKKIMCES
ncbi:MAG TPA: potassium channel protein [Bacteroidales bacterium]|nr:potassium channel protein [Bacteroidales bacterium]